MLPLRHLGFWRIAGLLLLLLVLLSALIPAVWFGDDRSGAFAWLLNADKLLHMITFTVLAIWFSGQYRRASYLRVAAGLLLFGLLIEFCQYLVGYREADWFDVAANTVGLVLGFAVAMAGLGGWSLRVEHWYTTRNTGADIG